MNWVRASLAGFVVTVSCLCSPAQELDTIRIVSISPDTGVALRVGEKVTFKVEVEYNLVSTGIGRITMVAQRAEAGLPPIANELEVVLKGAGKLVLSKEVEVPDTKTIQIFTPLTPEGAKSTRVVDSRYYKVETGSAGTPPALREKDSVKIIAISPDTHAALRVGEKVTVRVEVEYNLVSAESGRVTLVIQQGDPGRTPLGNGSEVVMKGKGKLEMVKDIEVPDTNALQIFIPLYVEGAGSTRVVDTRFYKVAKI